MSQSNHSRLGKSCRYHGDEASDELEVLEVVRVDVGRRVDLQTVVVLASILKQTVHGVQYLMREQEEPFPGSETIKKRIKVGMLVLVELVCKKCMS